MVLALGALALPVLSSPAGNGGRTAYVAAPAAQALCSGVIYTNCPGIQGEENAPEGLLNAVCTAIDEMEQSPMSYSQAMTAYYDCDLTFEIVGENEVKVTATGPGTFIILIEEI